MVRTKRGLSSSELAPNGYHCARTGRLSWRDRTLWLSEEKMEKLILRLPQMSATRASVANGPVANGLVAWHP